MLKGTKRMAIMTYTEGQTCPACHSGKLKMIGGSAKECGGVEIVEIQLECSSCSAKFLDEKQTVMKGQDNHAF